MSETIICLNDIRKTYGDINALNGINLEIKKNQIFGLLGSNGAGKSTLIHALIGLVKPDNGQITICNEKIQKKFPTELKRKVSIVPQKLSLYEELSIQENLFFFAKAYIKDNDLIKKRINLLSEIFSLNNLKRKVKHLSGGYQRRVSFAVALIGDPEIIILDEPLVGIDLETRNIILNLLNELKKEKTIILTTHSMDEAQKVCDSICFLHKGQKLLQGKVKEIIAKFSSHLGTIFKINFQNEKSLDNCFNLLKEKFPEIKKSLNSIEIKINKNNNKNLIYETIKSENIELHDIEIIKPGLGEILLYLIKEANK